MIGKVVSNKMMNTVVVEVETTSTHPMYNKRMSKTKKYHAHDTIGVKVGDVVEIVETRPISKTKKFKVVSISGSK